MTGNYYAMCAECEPQTPMPFAFVEDREEWIEIHKEATGHRVLIAQDVDFDALNA